MLATEAADEADGLADLLATEEADEAEDESDLESDSAATEAADEAEAAEELGKSADGHGSPGCNSLLGADGSDRGGRSSTVTGRAGVATGRGDGDLQSGRDGSVCLLDLFLWAELGRGQELIDQSRFCDSISGGAHL